MVLVTLYGRAVRIVRMTQAPLGPQQLRAHARAQLRDYLLAFPAEASGLHALATQLADDTQDVFARANMRGHITTSALVHDAAADAVLLIHHKTLGRWLQPGGHHEGGERLCESAAREAAEETGVAGLVPRAWHPQLQAPLDIDSHRIPARPARGEGEHVHHDFIYLFGASSSAALQPQLQEVDGARRLPREMFAALPEPRFARLAAKLRALRA